LFFSVGLANSALRIPFFYFRSLFRFRNPLVLVVGQREMEDSFPEEGRTSSLFCLVNFHTKERSSKICLSGARDFYFRRQEGRHPRTVR